MISVTLFFHLFHPVKWLFCLAIIFSFLGTGLAPAIAVGKSQVKSRFCPDIKDPLWQNGVFYSARVALLP